MALVLTGDGAISGLLPGGLPDNSILARDLANSGYELGMRNRIINGAMMIDQRNAGASVSATNNTYTLDRWFSVSYDAGATTGKYTVQQNAGAVTPPVGFSNYLGVVSSAATSVSSSGIYCLNQTIEGFNISDLAWGTANAKPVTLSFQVYSSLTGTFGGAINAPVGSYNYPFSYSIPVANTWTTISVTIPGPITGTWPTNNAAGMSIRIGLGGGASWAQPAGAWTSSTAFTATGCVSVVGTNGATFYITGVQLEKGSQATPFEWRSYGTELALCQRYFSSSWPTGVAVGAYGANTYYSGISTGTATVNQIIVLVGFPVEMRAIPTFTTYDIANPPAAGKAYKGGNGKTSYATAGSTRQIYAGSQDATSSPEMVFQWTANAEL